MKKIIFSILLSISMSLSCTIGIYADEVQSLQESYQSQIGSVSIQINDHDVMITVSCTDCTNWQNCILNLNEGTMTSYTTEDASLIFTDTMAAGEYEVQSLSVTIDNTDYTLDLSSLENRSFEITDPALTLDTTSITLLEGDSVQLQSSCTCSWTSENEEVASVENGLVQALKTGDTVIVASNDHESVECSVHVDSIEAPVLTSVTNTFEGILVQWQSVEDADSYIVYRKDDLEYEELATVSETSYLDSSVMEMKDVSYVIKAAHKGYTSQYSNDMSLSFVPYPVISSITNTTSGLKVKWTKVQGATGYILYRWNGTKWKRVYTNSTNYFTDTNVEAGNTYLYTVKAYTASSKSSYDPDGVSATRLLAPALLKITSEENCLKVTWDGVAGAQYYNVYRKTTGSYECIATNVSDLFYIDTNVDSTQSYTYTIRAVNGDTKSLYVKAGISGMYLAQPVPVLKSVTSGAKISWSAIENAQGYIIYRRTETGKWKRLSTTTKTTYTDTNALLNTKYYYTVKAYYQTSYSSYDPVGIEATLTLGSVTLKNISVNGCAIVISWNKADNAKSYKVYRKATGSWKLIATTTSKSYLDSSVCLNKNYTYTVRAVNGDEVSSYDKTGLTIMIPAEYVLRTYNQLFKVNNLIVVDKKHGLPSDYAPGEDPTAGNSIRQLISDMRAYGYDISTSYSGYRSYATQAALYAGYCASSGQAAADTFSARPGFSEHQTGLAFDLMNTSGALVTTTPEANWIAANAYKYGFIVRYTAEKQSITGYMAEPWHLRYVGSASLAKKIRDSGLCLEEYLGVIGGDY